MGLIKNLECMYVLLFEVCFHFRKKRMRKWCFSKVLGKNPVLKGVLSLQYIDAVRSARSAKAEPIWTAKASQSETANDGDLDNENSQSQTEPRL